MRYLIGLALFVFIVNGCSTAKAVKEDVVDAKDWTVERTKEGYQATKEGLNDAANWTKRQFQGTPTTDNVNSVQNNVVIDNNTELNNSSQEVVIDLNESSEQNGAVQKDIVTEDIEVIDLTPDANVTK